MTTAQHLDRSITIQRLEGVPNEFNEIVDQEWRTVVRVRAERVDVSDGEKLAAGGIGGYLAARFIVRHSSIMAGIRYEDRIIHEGLQWNIIGLKEGKEGRRRWIEITANVSAP